MNKKLIYLYIFISTVRLYGYNWPFKENENFTTEQKIRQTLGAYRHYLRFHRGVDIVPNDTNNRTVYAVIKGVVEGLWANVEDVEGKPDSSNSGIRLRSLKRQSGE